jgi:REP element-mobilizing transposase RayT
MDEREGSHAVVNMHYYFVRVATERCQVLKGGIGLKGHELIRPTREAVELEMLTGGVSQNPVPGGVSAPATAASEIMRRIKGPSSRKRFERFPAVKKRRGEVMSGHGAAFVRRLAD